MTRRDRILSAGAALATSAAVAATLLAGGPGAPQVSVDEVNPGTTVERDLCLSVSLAPGAASECGDLRLAHALPAVLTLNKARAPVLLYNSQHASPRPIVAAQVTLPDGNSGLSRVVATLKVNGTPRGQGVWKGTEWPGNGPVRIAVGYDAASDSTGPYRYTLEVRAVYGSTTVSNTARGQLVVVNRRESAFGAGWWLAGLERLVLDPFGHPVLWVGGDGSTRRYTTSAADTTIWGAPSLDRPDTLKRTPTGWVRLLAGDVRVEFDNAGRHVATVNRFQQRTEFLYDAAGRVMAATIPEPPRELNASDPNDNPKFSFVYGTDGLLQRAESPGIGTPRITWFERTGRRVDSIRDPDSTRVQFGYADAGALVPTSRTNPLGVPTYFRFDVAGRVAGSRIDPNSTDSIVTRLRAMESLGLAVDGAGAVDTAHAYALVDGPREVADSTRFWLDRWGAPRRTLDATGRETVLARENAAFPALVTRISYPVSANGGRKVVDAWFNARGGIDSTTDRSTWRVDGGDTTYATTHYAYQNLRWPDQVTTTTTPMGETTSVGYDDLGRPEWIQTGPNAARRTRFEYHTTGSGAGQVSRVVQPQIAGQPESAESYGYDTRGNLRTVTNALGVVVSTTERDELGRPWQVRTPTESGKPPVVTTMTYKVHTDLVETSQTVGPNPQQRARSDALRTKRIRPRLPATLRLPLVRS